ncbi:reverse transcriptase domain-containing protein [Comamonas sp. MYb396]|uniref:reverse transcriptase domain-containing protein n=1 Tax=Comamonas sp. MYb396 TaxID=2745302 RepID=UPI0030DA860F
MDPYIKRVPKASGGDRLVTVYQIPDTAVSALFYSDLISKNRHRFSSFSYAYRNDRNVHFAIQDLSVELSKNSRSFIAEFDFSDFFGSIDHEYLFGQLHQDGFLVSDLEERVIRAFLKKRGKGIPQGTSLSLFLANLVCWRLDKTLERNGLIFARYADDTVVFSQSYESICRAYNAVDEFSRATRVPVNLRKSDGINLLSLPGAKNEISSKENFDFLGYSVGINKISAKEATVKRIKKQISYLLFRNLIQPLTYYPNNIGIMPANNRDKSLLIAMSQIRRYLYGGLLHRQIWSYVNKKSASIHFKGVLSFYPLINDSQQLSELDGWLVSTIFKSINKRRKLLIQLGFVIQAAGFPFNVPQEKLAEAFKNTRIKKRRLLELPSFTLFYKAMERGILELGLEKVMHAESSKYQYA